MASAVIELMWWIPSSLFISVYCYPSTRSLFVALSSPRRPVGKTPVRMCRTTVRSWCRGHFAGFDRDRAGGLWLRECPRRPSQWSAPSRRARPAASWRDRRAERAVGRCRWGWCRRVPSARRPRRQVGAGSLPVRQPGLAGNSSVDGRGWLGPGSPERSAMGRRRQSGARRREGMWAGASPPPPARRIGVQGGTVVCRRDAWLPCCMG